MLQKGFLLLVVEHAMERVYREFPEFAFRVAEEESLAMYQVVSL